MTALIHYAAGYILDFFRERVSEDDFGDEEVTRVAVPTHLDEESLHRLRRLFPAAEFRSAGPRTDLWRVRRLRFDVACIPMRGGQIRWRLIAVLSGARHKLLLPAPDYVYRLGMRKGAAELLWALIDRFVLAPIALIWLGVSGAAAYGTGLVRRARSAPPARAIWRPRRVLLLRLMPTRDLVALLKRVRRDFGGVRLTAVLASEEGRTEVQRVSNEVISPRTGGLGRIIRIVRGGRFDTVILAGGEDYGLRPSHLKAVALALLIPQAARYQWEIGDSLPGIPLRKAVARALWRTRSRSRRPGPLGRIRLRRRYGKEPTRGPAMAQIGITKGCNYHCLFCAFHSPAAERGHRDADLPRMSFESFARVLGHLKSMGTTAIDICGDGEPLMHPEALDMIEFARDLGFDVTLATNAALLTEARARRLVDLRVRRMHVSFNAVTDDVYQALHAGAPPGARRRILTRLREMAETGGGV